MQFSNVPLAAAWAAATEAKGFADPTPVQAAVWEPFLGGRDLIVRSGTGTGKTLAYLLPLFQKLDPTRKDLQGLVLAPTQELVVQIQRQMDWLSAGSPVRTLALPGGASLPRQLEQLKAKPHVVVGTPGRIAELLEKKKLTGHFVASVVLDEADRLLDDANRAVVAAVLKTTLKTRQTTLFSASIPAATEAAAGPFLRDPLKLDLEAAEAIPGTIGHWFFTTELQEKGDLLRKLVHSLEPQRTIVFLNKPDQIENLTARLVHHGLKAENLHGSLFQQDRKRALERFHQGEVTLLVASDLAARGLDIPDVTHVVHFDIPENPLDYQHRCGRTGRAGKAGLSLALATEYEVTRLKEIEKAFHIRLEPKGIRHGTVYDVKG
jgi:ATP-dependent RNA helicase DeaD